MQIPPEMLKCSVFVGYETGKEKEYEPVGTAFWIARRMNETFNSGNFAYLVTARHVIDKFVDAKREKIILRINLKNKSSIRFPTETRDWETHPDPKVDAAILQLTLPDEWDHACWLIDDFATKETLANHGITIGVGDETFFAGAFWPHQGKLRAIPIMRMGNIAAMPSIDDPVEIEEDRFPDPTEKIRFRFPAYFVEARSIGGLSGCPVFVDIYAALRREDREFESPSFFLIGLMYGHFKGTENAWDNLGGTDNEKRVNMGIAIVLPCERILEMVEMFREEEEQALAKRKPSYVAVADSLPRSNVSMQSTRMGVEIPIPSKEDFLNILQKASDKKKK